ncbi:MAG: hypothetical protein ACRD2Z_01370 [Thermoanaerobaculia bacterium]
MAGGEGVGLPRSTVLVSSGAIALIGVLAFFIVTWNTKRTQAATLRDEIAAFDATLAEKRQELDPLERQQQTLQGQTDLFARGKMCVLNPSSDTRATITKLVVIYLDDAGEFQTFSNEAAGGVTWPIAPGHTEMLGHGRSGWDGSVTYFALWYSVGGQEFPLAEAWPLDPKHCARLPL